ncbi:hypothetical protein NC651_007854 [Populus alba x Populus x berolinensis]|nr:hypothetical protein NC651_007854 [Populus alba x Populus x berolinensis]
MKGAEDLELAIQARKRIKLFGQDFWSNPFISVLKTRVILCFPFVSGGDIGGHSPWNQFIAVDTSSPAILETQHRIPLRKPSLWELQRNPGAGKKIKVKGYEFASATAAKDLGDINLRTRGELILSSAFFLHVHLFPVVVDLSSSQYSNLHFLLDQMINGLSGMACDVVGATESTKLTRCIFVN